MRPRILALLVLQTLVAFSAIPGSADDNFFPIGLFEAGVYPKDPRRCCSLMGDLEPCRMASSDTCFDAPEWSSFDEIRGDWAGAPDTVTYGYTSGFNVVQDYFYKSALTFSHWDVKRYVDLAAAYGLKVVIGLPGSVGDGDPLPLGERLHFFQQSPPIYQPAIDLIEAFEDEANLYGWYLVDEPTNSLNTSSTDCKDDGFHVAGVSPLRLKAAMQEFKEYDETHPYIVTLPDYNSIGGGHRNDGYSALGYWGVRDSSDYWRWDNDSEHTMIQDFPDTCHGGTLEIPMTQDYSQSADVIQNDTYISPAVGESQANLAWSNLLHQYDEALESKGGGIQAVLAIASCSNPIDCPDCVNTTVEDCTRFSLETLRFQAFSAIIHGVSGIWFWSYAKTYEPCTACNACVRYSPNEENSYFEDTLVPLSQQLDSLDTFFLADELGRYSWGDSTGLIPSVRSSSGSEEARIHCTLRKRDGELLLIATNTANAEFDVHFRCDGLSPATEVRALTEAATAARIFPAVDEADVVLLHNQVLSDNFDPFETHIYRFRQYRVPEDFLDLSEAISNSEPGDLIRVSTPGTRAAITIPAGIQIMADVPGVVIDANSFTFNAVTVLSQDPNPGTLIRGVTLRGFTYSGVHVDSGMTYPVVIEDCSFEAPDNQYAVLPIGVRAYGSPVEISRCTFIAAAPRYFHTGVFASAGAGESIAIRECTFQFSGSGQALQLSSSAGEIVVEGNSLRGHLGGMNLSASSGAVLMVRENALEGTAGYALTGIAWSNSSTPNPTILRNISYGHSFNYLNSITSNGSIPTGNLGISPRFCQSGVALNASSPCIPANNPWNEWVGVSREVTCMSGTLDASLSTSPVTLDLTRVPNGELKLTSDFRVASGKTLTIGPGIAVRADQNDEANLGINASENEIIVDDARLLVAGTSQSKVVFRSTAASPIAGDWGGFYVKNGGDLKLTYADISHATYGVLAVGLADTISLTNTSMDSCQQVVVQVNNRCTPYFPEVCTATRLLISGGTISTNTATHGILTYFPLEVTVVGTTITGSASTFYGIFADTMGSGAAEAEIKNCTITGLTAGTGIYLRHGSPALKSNLVKDCKWGIQLRGPGTPLIQRATTSGIGTRLDHCATGLYVQSASAIVDSVSVEPGGLSGAVCVSSVGASGGTYTKLKLLGGTVGFVASSTASPVPTLRNSQIRGFTVNGTKHEGTGGLDLGTLASVGNNWIESSGASGKWVLVKTCPSGGATLPARYNYWGGDPIASKFSACVDYSNWLSSQQTSVAAARGIAVEAAPRAFVATPNPFTGGVSFAFPVVADGAVSVRLKLFDLAGRLVRTVAEGEMTNGSHELNWDGRDETGSVVGSGIYFARLQVGPEQTTHKLIKLP